MNAPSCPSEPDKTKYGFEIVFLLSEVFSKLGLSRSCSQASQRSWNEFSSGPSYLWESPATDPSPSWPASSSSPTHTATVSTQGSLITTATVISAENGVGRLGCTVSVCLAVSSYLPKWPINICQSHCRQELTGEEASGQDGGVGECCARLVPTTSELTTS